VLAVEVVFDGRLVAACYKNEMLDACGLGLVDHVLNDRAVDHRQHFLGDRLGGRQEARAEARHREDGFPDALSLAWHGQDLGFGLSRHSQGASEGCWAAVGYTCRMAAHCATALKDDQQRRCSKAGWLDECSG